MLKWAPNGNSTYYNFKLQGEYFRLKQNGSLIYNDTAGSNVFGQVASSLDSATQSGWYAQAVWQFHPQWRVGYRYDRLNYGTLNNGIVTNGLGPTAADFPVLANHSPTRNTLMFDWSPTEFSRIRLQFAVGQIATRTHRQSGVRAVHLQPGRAWRAQVLERCGRI